MLVSAAKLRKVRHRSLHELCVRGKQETAKWAERLRRAVPGEMSDEAWLGELRPASEASLARQVPRSFSSASEPHRAGRFSPRWPAGLKS